MKLFSRADDSIFGRWWWTVDRPLLFSFIALIFIGVVMVTTASPPTARHLGLNDFHFLIRHLIFLVPSCCFLIGLSFLDDRWVWRFASILFLGTVVALIMVLFFGMEIKGAKRWLHLPGMSLQPSEFIKPAFAVVGAWLMSLQKTQENFPGNSVTAALYLGVISLLLLQPDLGMTVVVSAIWGVQIFLAGFPFRLLILLLIVGVGGLVGAYFTFPHVESRVNRFFHPESGDNLQVERSLEAIKNGGIMGTGPGQGEVKLRIPDAHADFIFSVAGEEMGAIFLFILLGVFLFVLLRGIHKLNQSEDIFRVLAVGGLLTMFGLQAFIHMGSALNILPAKGMTLPFISYGGSSMLSISIAMGCLLALTRQSGKASLRK